MDTVTLTFKTNNEVLQQKVFPVDVEAITLSGLGIISIDLSPLESCTKLRDLLIASNWLEMIDLGPLRHCPSFELLSLSLNRLLEVDLSPLGDCPEFLWLNLERNWLQQVDISPLFLCPKFVVLEIDYDVELRADSRFTEEELVPEGLRGLLDRIKVKETRVPMIHNPPEFLVVRLRQVVELFKLLPLDLLVELLRFSDTEILLEWLQVLPRSLPLQVEGKEVEVLSDFLPEDTSQAILEGPVVGHPQATQAIRDFYSNGQQLMLGSGVAFKPQVSEDSLLQWLRDSMTSHEEGRWRHAAIEGWTVLGALLSAIYRVHFRESKPLHLPYSQMIQDMAPYLSGDPKSVSVLERANKLREGIYLGSEEPTFDVAEQIIEAAFHLYSKLDVLLVKPEPIAASYSKPVEGMICPICSRALRTGERIITTPCCEVDCHFKHLVNWVRSNGLCPECRSPLIIRRDMVTKL